MTARTRPLKVTAYQSRANQLQFDLLVDNELVDPNLLTRAVVRLESTSGSAAYSIDTADSVLIDLNQSATTLTFQPGLIDYVIPGDYHVYITLYDSAHPAGFSWGASSATSGYYDGPALTLKVIRWPA